MTETESRYGGPPEARAGPELRRKVVHGAGYTLSLVELSQDSEPALLSNPHEQACTIPDGQSVFILNGKRHPVEGGDVVLIPSNVLQALPVPGSSRVTVLVVFVQKRPEFSGTTVQDTLDRYTMNL